MPTITGYIAIADVEDGQTFTRYYSTLSTGGSISTTQGSRTYFYDVLHRADLAPTPPTASTVFNLLIATDGVTTYTWVKYADNSTGTSGLSDSSVGKSYIGFAFNKTTPTESTTPSDYTWSLIKGADGTDADIYKTIYLFQNGTSSPTVPASTAGFNTTTGIAVNTGSWTANATVPSAGQSIYVASALLVQTEGTGSWANNGSWVSNPAASSGSNGTPGSDAPRFAELKLYTNPAISGTASVPSAPGATITWSTGALSSITSGWSRTPPTQVATSGDVVYESTLVFIDTTPPFSSTAATGSTPTKGISFSGLVTFSGGDFAVDGSTLTSIDGGNISTGTIAADQINVNAITGKNITVGTLTDTNIPTGTKEGVRISSNGTMVVGDINNYLRWDGEKLIVQGGIINFQEKFFRGQGRSDYATITTDTDNLVSTGVVSTGWNAFGLVAGGGGSSGGRRSENNGFASSGGGGGATIQFGLFVDENDTINVDVGSGGSLGFSTSSQAGSGGDTTFTLIRNNVTYVLTAGGGEGGRGNSYSLTLGGAGGLMSFTKDGVIQTIGQMQALGIFHSLSGQNGGKGGDTPNTFSNSQGRGGGGGGGVDIYLTKNIANISSTYVDGKIGNSTVGATAYGGSIWGLATGYATSDRPASGNQTTAGTVPAGLVIYNSPLIDSKPSSSPGNFMGAAGAPRPSGTTSSSGNSGGSPGGGAGGGSASWNSHDATSNSNGGNGGVGVIYYVAL